MALSLGLGLGLSHSNYALATTPPSTQDTICEAIKKRQHIVATIRNQKLLLEPYAVYLVEGIPTLDAVVVVSDGRPIRRWSAKRFTIDRLEGVETIGGTFIPSGVFKPKADAICNVELFDSVQDAVEAVSS